eukprot:956150-Pleurochrysis_carterae.AAC.2
MHRYLKQQIRVIKAQSGGCIGASLMFSVHKLSSTIFALLSSRGCVTSRLISKSHGSYPACRFRRKSFIH